MNQKWMSAVILACCAGLAQANAELAKEKNCMACHAVASKLLGPSFKDVARKYAAQTKPEATLAQSIVKGSSAKWGGMPMPPNPQVSDAEAQKLVLWILSQL